MDMFCRASALRGGSILVAGSQTCQKQLDDDFPLSGKKARWKIEGVKCGKPHCCDPRTATMGLGAGLPLKDGDISHALGCHSQE